MKNPQAAKDLRVIADALPRAAGDYSQMWKADAAIAAADDRADEAQRAAAMALSCAESERGYSPALMTALKSDLAQLLDNLQQHQDSAVIMSLQPHNESEDPDRKQGFTLTQGQSKPEPPLVAIIMGSKSDWETMRTADEVLTPISRCRTNAASCPLIASPELMSD